MVDTRTENLEDVYNGADYNATFQVTDGGTAVDISLYSFAATVVKSGTTTPLVNDKACALSDPTNGKFTLNLDPAETALFTVGDIMEYQVVGTSPSNEKEVYVTGRFVAKTLY